MHSNFSSPCAHWELDTVGRRLESDLDPARSPSNFDRDPIGTRSRSSQITTEFWLDHNQNLTNFAVVIAVVIATIIAATIAAIITSDSGQNLAVIRSHSKFDRNAIELEVRP